MRRALVLNGGGSRGAYEIGAWQGLDELGVKFQSVYGTSIGALNAALFAQGDLDLARHIWENITIGQIVTVEAQEDFAIDRMISRKRDVIPFLLENAKHLRADITPLEKLVAENLDEARIRARGMTLGVMTFRVPQLQPVPMTLDNMAPGRLADWVIASASCFPIFPERHIDGQIYVDGGYFDNLPVDMALNGGADEVVAVELHPEPTHPEYGRMPWLKLIKPRHDLGGFLDFDPRLLARSRMLGYHDTLKAYGRLDGFLYTFKPVSSLSVTPAARRAMAMLTRFDGERARRDAEDASLLAALEAETEFRALSWKDVWLRGVELCAGTMGYRVDAVYDAPALMCRIRQYCEGQAFDDTFDDRAITAAANQGPRRLLAFLFHRLRSAGDFPSAALRHLAEYPAITAAAIALAAEDRS